MFKLLNTVFDSLIAFAEEYHEFRAKQYERIGRYDRWY
jgi:hypothetical protein